MSTIPNQMEAIISFYYIPPRHPKGNANPESIVLNDYQVAAFLFDTYQKGNPGGTGENFNWKLIAELKTDTPIILSGGLNSVNILNGINDVNPSALDVNSGVESAPGIKDERKVEIIFTKLENTNGNGKLFQC